MGVARVGHCVSWVVVVVVWWWWWWSGWRVGVGCVVELVFVIVLFRFSLVRCVALLAVKMDVRYGSSSPPNRMNYYGNYK